jgi:poly-beta-1,6-N-acetyl-D-glucosamine biosynthesis protein PgaD
MIWRDWILTVAMWLLLFWLARRELYALWDVSRAMFVQGHLRFTGWQGRWALLIPYLKTIGVIATWELFWAAVSLWRRQRYSRLPQPQPLTPQEEANKVHHRPMDLDEWRKMKICVVEFDQDGTLQCRAAAAPGAPGGGEARY